MTTTKRRRSRGDGAAYQRCETQRGCPPTETITLDDGRTKKVRPEHKCNGRWVAVLDAGYSNGKRQRKVLYGSTKTDVLRKLKRAQGELYQRGTLVTSSPTLTDWLDTWLTEIAGQQIKPKTLRTYRTYVEQYIVPALGRKKLDKIEPADVRSLHRHITGKGLSSTTALNAHRVLSAALRAAVRERRVSRNVASQDFIDAPRKAANGRQGLSAEQARAVLRAARDDRLYSRWLFAFLTGARQGETLGLRWQHVDLDAGTVDLAWSLTQVPWLHGCGQPEPDHRPDHCPSRHMDIPAGFEHEKLHGNMVLMRPKTKGSTRTVPLAPPLVRALEARKLEVDVERDDYRKDFDLVWCRPTGHPIDGRKDWQAWKDLLKAAGAPDVTLHEARNTAASLLHEAGVDDGTAAQILGHSDVLTTRGYQRRDLTLPRKAVGELGDLLAN